MTKRIIAVLLVFLIIFSVYRYETTKKVVNCDHLSSLLNNHRLHILDGGYY